MVPEEDIDHRGDLVKPAGAGETLAGEAPLALAGDPKLSNGVGTMNVGDAIDGTSILVDGEVQLSDMNESTLSEFWVMQVSEEQLR